MILTDEEQKRVLRVFDEISREKPLRVYPDDAAFLIQLIARLVDEIEQLKGIKK